MFANTRSLLTSFLGRALSGLLLASTTACSPLGEPESTFENLWNEFDRLYGGFEIRNIDWDDTHDRYRPLVTDDMTDDEFFTVVTDMLAETNDGHVQIVAPDRMYWSANRIYREQIDFDLFDRDLVEQGYLGGEFEGGGKYIPTVGTLPSGHPYIHLPSIDDLMTRMLDTRKAAEAAGGLVIDMRHNGGGDTTFALSSMDHWSSVRRDAYRSRSRDGYDRDDFSGWHTWGVNGGGKDVDFPIIVLIDRFTISAGERLVLLLDTLDTVYFVGDRTNGAVSTMVPRDMLNGWTVTIATQEVFLLDDTTPEAVGFQPDEMLLNDPADMEAGVDAVLERAMALLEAGGTWPRLWELSSAWLPRLTRRRGCRAATR